ncbi:MAG: hypothetical protein ACJ0GK_00745 [Gammaproteobacteria bacterium]
MEEKYIKFYQNFHKAFDGKSNHCSNTLSDGGISASSDLKGDNNGRINSNRTSHCNVGHSIGSSGKTYKNPEEKGNSRRGLQGRVMHQTNLLNHGGVVSFAELIIWQSK